MTPIRYDFQIYLQQPVFFRREICVQRLTNKNIREKAKLTSEYILNIVFFRLRFVWGESPNGNGCVLAWFEVCCFLDFYKQKNVFNTIVVCGDNGCGGDDTGEAKCYR